jgi:hypothetical protein
LAALEDDPEGTCVIGHLIRNFPLICRLSFLMLLWIFWTVAFFGLICISSMVNKCIFIVLFLLIDSLVVRLHLSMALLLSLRLLVMALLFHTC